MGCDLSVNLSYLTKLIFLNLSTVAALKLYLPYPVTLTAEASTWPGESWIILLVLL
jgi:hypothetical protein